MERWLPLLGHSSYEISNLGEVRNVNTDRLVTAVQTSGGRYSVKLYRDGVSVRRGLSKLVGDTFLPPPKNPSFNTVIHFDGDLSNCKASNLDWRPRWFAIKHAMQFKAERNGYGAPLKDISSGEVFDSAWAAVLKYGLLHIDLVQSIENKTYVFPTMQTFEWM